MKKHGVKPEDAWRDFGSCILAEKQLDLARRAVGPDLDKNVIVSKHNFYKLQNEVKEKTEEIEELSTRLTKFTQLTEGNPSIAVLLSDVHRPTRLGEMYSQLFDDEWSEAFETFKPKKDEDEEEEDDDIFPDTLFTLHNLLVEIFKFCQTKAKTHKTALANALTIVLDEGNRVGKPVIGNELQHLLWILASKTTKITQHLFLRQELPNLVADEEIRGDLRTLTYVRKCVELCWYMCLQDPPMVIISPERGQEIDKGLFSLHGRCGKTVEVCVWPALLLHDGGQLVCKGYVLPEERKRKK